MRGCIGGEPGIDPYTRAVSDVYQDLFGEGSFIGKGIYDVDAFERALGDRCPRTASSATTCSKAAMRARACSATSQLLEDSAVALQRRRGAAPSLDPRRLAAVGWLRRRLHALPGAPRNPLSALSRGRCSTTCAAAWCPAATLATLLVGLVAAAAQPPIWTLRARR